MRFYNIPLQCSESKIPLAILNSKQSILKFTEFFQWQKKKKSSINNFFNLFEVYILCCNHGYLLLFIIILAYPWPVLGIMLTTPAYLSSCISFSLNDVDISFCERIFLPIISQTCVWITGLWFQSLNISWLRKKQSSTNSTISWFGRMPLMYNWTVTIRSVSQYCLVLFLRGRIYNPQIITNLPQKFVLVRGIIALYRFIHPSPYSLTTIYIFMSHRLDLDSSMKSTWPIIYSAVCIPPNKNLNFQDWSHS